MKLLGVILMIVGFFGAAFYCVRQTDGAGLEWQTINWTMYGAFFGVGAVGVILIRLSAHGAKTKSHKLKDDLAAMDTALSELVERLRGMNATAETTNVYDVHKNIDEHLNHHLAAFVDARESLIPIFGLQHYADLMNEFAGSERNINRAWSASADGYIDEVNTCMQRAEEHMARARSLLTEYQRSSGEDWRPTAAGD